jgi:uncharacterized membrane protein
MPTIVTAPESSESSCCTLNLEQNVGSAERVVSIIGGASCVVGGLVRGGLSGAALAIIGGGLLFRGLSGHCCAYQALGIDTRDEEEVCEDGGECAP